MIFMDFTLIPVKSTRIKFKASLILQHSQYSLGPEEDPVFLIELKNIDFIRFKNLLLNITWKNPLFTYITYMSFAVCL